MPDRRAGPVVRTCGRCGGRTWTTDRERWDDADGVVTAFQTCRRCGAEYVVNLGHHRSGMLPMVPFDFPDSD
jgi:hypothetical protein